MFTILYPVPLFSPPTTVRGGFFIGTRICTFYIIQRCPSITITRVPQLGSLLEPKQNKKENKKLCQFGEVKYFCGQEISFWLDVNKKPEMKTVRSSVKFSKEIWFSLN